MQFVSNARERALVLQEISKETKEFEQQAIHLARMWLTLAVIEDGIAFGARAAKGATIH